MLPGCRKLIFLYQLRIGSLLPDCSRGGVSKKCRLQCQYMSRGREHKGKRELFSHLLVFPDGEFRSDSREACGSGTFLTVKRSWLSDVLKVESLVSEGFWETQKHAIANR